MDPDVALAQLIHALETGDMDDAQDNFDNLAEWIENGGFLPKLQRAAGKSIRPSSNPGSVATVEDCDTVSKCLDAADAHIIDVLSFVMAAREGVQAGGQYVGDVTSGEGQFDDVVSLDEMYDELKEMRDELNDIQQEYD